MFLIRRLASSESSVKQKVCKETAATVLVHDWSTQEELREEQPVMVSEDRDKTCSEEARDEFNPLESFSSIVASLIAEATSMAVADDQTISEDESVGTAAVQPASERLKVKGSPITLARLIMKLDKQDREVEKLGKQLHTAEQQVMNDKQEQKMKKLQQQLDKAEQQVMNTRKRINALSEKFELHDILKDAEFEERLGDVL